MRLSRVQYDSPGSDKGSNKRLNAGWVRVENLGGKAKVLTGWTIRDPEGHLFTFPAFGTNTGDRAVMRNKRGVRVDTCRWNDGSGSTPC